MLTGRRLSLAVMVLASIWSCSKLKYKPTPASVEFEGIKTLVPTKEGSYVIGWDAPAASSAEVQSFEVIVQEMKGLALQGEAAAAPGATNAGVLVDIDDQLGPATNGKVFAQVSGQLSYTLAGLLPGNYGIQVKAIDVDGARDANKKVLLLTVSTKITFAGITSAGLVGSDIVLTWPAFVTDLKGDPIFYRVFEGANFTENETLVIVKPDAEGNVATEYRFSAAKKIPGSEWSYGVRVKDPLGNVDQNVKTVTLKIPTDDIPYAGCIDGSAQGSSKIEITFDFPKGTEQVNVYRNNIKVYGSKSAEDTTFLDQGLQEGETYTYTCEALVLGTVKPGAAKQEIETFNSNPPTFLGIVGATLQDKDVTVAWGVATGVPAREFHVFANPGDTVDWTQTPRMKPDAVKLSQVLVDFGDELPYSFGVRACTKDGKNCDKNIVSIKKVMPDWGPPKTVGATAINFVEGNLVVTAPWTHLDGAIKKRRVYVYKGTADANDITKYTVAKTVVVDDVLNPPTEITLDSVIENTVYNVVVIDEDPSGNTNTNFNKISKTSGDLSPPQFAGITALTLGAVGEKETTLLARFLAVAKESDVPTGASFYQVLTREGGGDACAAGVLRNEFAQPSTCVAGQNCETTVRGLKPKTLYSVCLKARDLAGNVSLTDSFLVKSTIDTTPPVFDGLESLTYSKTTGLLNAAWNESGSDDTLEYVVKVWKGTDPPLENAILTLAKAHPGFKLGFALDKTQFAFGSNDTVNMVVNACDKGALIPQGQRNCTALTIPKSVTLDDIDPPAGFAGIAASSDQLTPTQGTVRIKWIAPSNANWPQYRGFKVFIVNPVSLALTLASPCPCLANGCAERPLTCDVVDLDPYRTYLFHVQAYDDAQNHTLFDPIRNYSVEVRTSDTTPPVFSSNLGVAFANGGTDITWNAASDNQYAREPGAVVSYEVYRKTNSGFANTLNPAADGILLTSTPVTLYRDSKDYESGKRYFYTVCAVDASLNRTCDGTQLYIDTPDLIPPQILTFTTTKLPDDKLWSLNFTYTDNLDANSALLVKIRRTYSATPQVPASNLSPILSAYGAVTLGSLKGLPNVDGYVNYLITVQDSAQNVASANLSVYSQNLITITSVASDEGKTGGGNLVIVKGTGFHASSTIKFDTTPCAQVEFLTKELIYCKEAPSHAASTVGVRVANSDDSQVTLPNAYSYCVEGSCSNICGNPASWPPSPSPPFAAGNGSSGDPFVICNDTQLNLIRTLGHGMSFALGENIDLAAYNLNNFPPIQTHVNEYAYINFDGRNHVVANWTYAAPPGVSGVGLFKFLADGYTIKNFGMVNVNISGKDDVGAISGYISTSAGTHENLFATGTVQGSENVGGLVGYLSAKLFGGYFNGTVSGNRYVGGISGQKYNIQSDVSASGTVTAAGGAAFASYCMVGGLFGQFVPPYQSTLDKATFNGTVTCTDPGSGFVGGIYAYHGNGVVLTNAYMKGTISGGFYVGGLAGMAYYGAFEDSSADVELVTTATSVGGLVGYLESSGRVTRSHAKGKITSSSSATGGLVGTLNNSIIDTSYAEVAMIGTSSVGGMVGNTTSGEIKDSYAKGTVTGTSTVGGLVGYDNNSKVKRSFANGKVTGTGSYIGGLFGQIYLPTDLLEDSYATGEVSGNSNVGGFAGYLYMSVGGKVSRCYSSSKVTASTSAGGFIGTLAAHVPQPAGAESITDSHATGDVKATGTSAGGFIGDIQAYAATGPTLITRNYATGNVEGTSYTGGFLGYMHYQNLTLASNYATGNVKGDTYVGGFLGYSYYNYFTEYLNNYSLGDVTGNDIVGGFAGYSSDVITRSFAAGKVTAAGAKGGFMGGVRYDVTYGKSSNNTISTNTYFDKDGTGLTASVHGTGKTNAEMKNAATFTNFDFVNVWKMPATDGYPIFIWQP